jgi:ribonuclease HIII
MPALTSYTHALTAAQAEKLLALLADRGFEFQIKPYCLYAAAKSKVNVLVYEKGPKVVVQGKETEDFVTHLLEPEVLGEAILGYEEVHHPEMFQPHIGVDESGKGDFFGPLVVAGVYIDGQVARRLRDDRSRGQQTHQQRRTHRQNRGRHSTASPASPGR